MAILEFSQKFIQDVLEDGFADQIGAAQFFMHLPEGDFGGVTGIDQGVKQDQGGFVLAQGFDGIQQCAIDGVIYRARALDAEEREARLREDAGMSNDVSA